MPPAILGSRLPLLLFLVIGSLAIAACGGDEEEGVPGIPAITEVPTQVAAGRLDSSGGVPSQSPVAATVPPLSETQNEEAVEIAREAGLIDQIAGDQPWTASDFFRIDITSSSNAIVFNASWDNPVESSGPWRNVNCRGSRVFESFITWADVHMLRVIVDLDGRQVVGTGVRGAPASGTSLYPDPVPIDSFDDPEAVINVYDLESGQALYEGNLGGIPEDLMICPPGFEDD